MGFKRLSALQIKTLKDNCHIENQGQNYKFVTRLQIFTTTIEANCNLKINIGFGVVIKKEGIRNSVIRQMYSNEIETDHSFPLHMQPF